MDIESATEILVIITSSVLVIFLIGAIFATVLFVKVLNKLKRLADKAESVVDAVESIGDAVKMANSPFRFGRLVQSFAETFKQAKTKKRK